MPDGFRRSYQAFMDSEFWRLDLPGSLDGTPAPRAFWWSFAEMVLGSNAPIWMYASGPSFATTLEREGTEEQKRWAKIFADKRWGSTMVLTEPDAGFGRRRRPHSRDPAAGRLLAHRGRQALHHQRRARPGREHHSLRSGAAGGHTRCRRPGHQGPVAVHRAEVPLRLGRPANWASATASSPPTSSTRWASRLRRPARSPSVSTAPRPRAGCSATCTRASGRCS